MFRQASLPLFLALSPVLPAEPDAALERRFRRSIPKKGPVAIGSAVDPYDPAVRGTARSLLETFLRQEGLEISLTTRSPRIEADLDLLVELDRRHSVTVRITVPALDPELAREAEPQGPDPRSRMRAARALASEGITTTLLCGPLKTGVNDSEAVLRPLLAEAREAGVYDVEVDADGLARTERPAILATFRRLRLEHGFPLDIPGRG